MEVVGSIDWDRFNLCVGDLMIVSVLANAITILFEVHAPDVRFDQGTLPQLKHLITLCTSSEIGSQTGQLDRKKAIIPKVARSIIKHC